MKIDPDDLPPPKEPYRGILPFRLLDWRIFLERDAEAERLGNLVSMYSGVLLFGQSGLGKSSLVNAGLIPHALRQGRAPERIRVFPERGRELLVERIQLQEPEETEVGSKNKLPRYLPSRFTSSDDDERVALSCENFLETLHTPSDLGVPLLIFDQFEELVTLFEESPKDEERFKGARDARVAIDRMLCELLLNDPLPFKVVFAFRDDYLARLGPLFSRIPNLMDQGLRMASLPVELVKQIVRGPFVRSEDGERGLPGHFGDELSEELADKITVGIRASKPSGLVNLSEVQTLCLALWQQPKRRLQLLGADNPAAVLQQIIESTAVAKLKKLRPWDRVRALALLANLVTQEGTRDVVSEENLISETRRNPLMWVFPRDWRKLLNELPEKTGLLRRSLSSGTTYYELASEFLISWIQRRQRAFRRLALMVSGSISVGLLAIVILLVFLAVGLQKAKDNVVREKNKAEAAERRAIQQSKIAKAAERRAIQQKNKAEAAERRAIQQSKIAQTESFRVRKQNLDDNETIINMADKLLESATPDEAAIWHIWKGQSMRLLGRSKDAILEGKATLETDPENLFALGVLPDDYNQQGAAEEALAASDAALQKGHHDWLVYQTRARILGLLRHYKEGEEAFRNSNEKFTVRGSEPYEVIVSPDIQSATRRKIFVDAELAMRAANYYGIANLRAYAGDATFPQALEEARKQPSTGDAALIALNWAWMHMEKRPEDYGALIAQAALWEQAKLPTWAKKYYVEFERLHRQNANPRYGRLADWAGKQLKELQAVGEPVADAPDAQTLRVQAMELLDRKDNEGALKPIKEAIALDPGSVSLLLEREQIDLAREDFAAVKQDSDAILQKAPRTPVAHECRALAMIQLGEPVAEAEKEFRLAVEYDKTDFDSMIGISDLVATRDPDEALRWLERSRHIIMDRVSLAWVHERIAKIQLDKKQFPEASESIKTAILIKRDEPTFYDLRAEIERGISDKASKTVVAHHLCEGYIQAGDTCLRLGRKAEALSLYWGNIERLAPLRKSKNKGELDRDIAGAVSKISSVIESTASRAKVSEFWKTAIDSGRWNEVRGLFAQEARRLSTAR